MLTEKHGTPQGFYSFPGGIVSMWLGTRSFGGMTELRGLKCYGFLL